MPQWQLRSAEIQRRHKARQKATSWHLLADSKLVRRPFHPRMLVWPRQIHHKPLGYGRGRGTRKHKKGFLQHVGLKCQLSCPCSPLFSSLHSVTVSHSGFAAQKKKSLSFVVGKKIPKFTPSMSAIAGFSYKPCYINCI